MTENGSEKIMFRFVFRFIRQISDFGNFHPSPQILTEKSEICTKFLRQILRQIGKRKRCLQGGTNNVLLAPLVYTAALRAPLHPPFIYSICFLFSFRLTAILGPPLFSWQSSYLTRSPAVWSSSMISNEFLHTGRDCIEETPKLILGTFPFWICQRIWRRNFCQIFGLSRQSSDVRNYQPSLRIFTEISPPDSLSDWKRRRFLFKTVMGSQLDRITPHLGNTRVLHDRTVMYVTTVDNNMGIYMAL